MATNATISRFLFSFLSSGLHIFFLLFISPGFPDNVILTWWLQVLSQAVYVDYRSKHKIQVF